MRASPRSSFSALRWELAVANPVRRAAHVRRLERSGRRDARSRDIPCRRQRAASTTAVPFKGSLEGTYAGSGEPPLVSVHLEAQGNATHLGRFTLDSPHVVNFVDFTGAGTADFTAADGDKLMTNVTGVATPEDAPGVFFIVETHTVTGGTADLRGPPGNSLSNACPFQAAPQTVRRLARSKGRSRCHAGTEIGPARPSCSAPSRRARLGPQSVPSRGSLGTGRSGSRSKNSKFSGLRARDSNLAIRGGSLTKGAGQRVGLRRPVTQGRRPFLALRMQQAAAWLAKSNTKQRRNQPIFRPRLHDPSHGERRTAEGRECLLFRLSRNHLIKSLAVRRLET